MRRRQFITLLGGAAAWPLVASAQQAGQVYRIGILSPVPRNTRLAWTAFFNELQQRGFVEGQNLTVDGRGFASLPDQYPGLLAEMVKSAADAIMCTGDAAIRAAQQATTTIPILGGTDDMIGAGLVQSLARPGGNTTGVSLLATDLDGKRQDILMELVPGVSRVAALADPLTSSPAHLDRLVAAARERNVALSIHRVARSQDILPAIGAAKAAGAEALNVLATPLLSANRQTIILAAAAQRLPAIYQWPEIPGEGGLAAYGPRQDQYYRQRARQLAKVLHGAKPADIPVELPIRYELVINLKAAKAIGHEVPAALALRADEVIE